MLRNYPAIVHKERRSDFGVSFPDFPGCVTAGATPEEALELAGEALQFHVDGALADGDSLPDPTPLTEVIAKLRDLGALAAFVVPVRLPGRAKRVDITLAEDLLEEIDRIAEERGTNRSRFIADATRALIGRVRMTSFRPGQRLGSWVVVGGWFPDEHGIPRWTVRCDGCKRELVVREDHVRAGGCARCRNVPDDTELEVDLEREVANLQRQGKRLLLEPLHRAVAKRGKIEIRKR
jgi:predicted RNase H-like HicB family nuclease